MKRQVDGASGRCAIIGLTPAVEAMNPLRCCISSHGDSALIMYRMYGILQGARDGGAVMYRIYGILQGARDGGAATPAFFLAQFHQTLSVAIHV